MPVRRGQMNMKQDSLIFKSGCLLVYVVLVRGWVRGGGKGETRRMKSQLHLY